MPKDKSPTTITKLWAAKMKANKTEGVPLPAGVAVPAPTPAAELDGGFFVCGTVAGKAMYWTDQGWSPGRTDAVGFNNPPFPDPWLACKYLCDILEEKLGIHCSVIYLPRARKRQ